MYERLIRLCISISNIQDNQVPVCPLCNKPIPLLPGENADAKVGQHIDSDCQSDPAMERRGKVRSELMSLTWLSSYHKTILTILPKKSYSWISIFENWIVSHLKNIHLRMNLIFSPLKVYTNRCAKKGCKKKELLPMTCENCRQNFCIRHRHETDHDCAGFGGSGRGMSAAGWVETFHNRQWLIMIWTLTSWTVNSRIVHRIFIRCTMQHARIRANDATFDF